MLVMATTSPAPLVTPFAERLGFDAVVATQWASADGAYTGEIDGPLVWGRGKLEAVRAWAAEAGVDLRGSWAYSDSYYDAPLLDAVGHPTAVNADLRLVALARLKGWPLRHFDLPEGVLKIAGRELQEWTRPLPAPELLANVRLDIAGIEKIPTTGPGDRRVQPPQLLRRARSSAPCSARPAARSASSARRRSSTPRSSAFLLEDGRRDPCQPVVGLERAAGARHPGPARPARPWPWRRRARSRVARRSSSPS